MTEQQFKEVEHSFKHSDVCVFKVGNKVYISDEIYKHLKQGTIEFKNCSQVDETCFYNEEYYGDVLPGTYDIILRDPCAVNENCIATLYYKDEIVEIK